MVRLAPHWRKCSAGSLAAIPHFVTFSIVGWIDVFSREQYKELFIQSLQYCIEQKGLIIHAWVIMTNHVHLIINSAIDYYTNQHGRHLFSIFSFNSRCNRADLINTSDLWEHLRQTGKLKKASQLRCLFHVFHSSLKISATFYFTGLIF